MDICYIQALVKVSSHNAGLSPLDKSLRILQYTIFLLVLRQAAITVSPELKRGATIVMEKATWSVGELWLDAIPVSDIFYLFLPHRNDKPITGNMTRKKNQWKFSIDSFYSLAVCSHQAGESEFPQQGDPCGENTWHQSALPGTQTSAGSPGSALEMDKMNQWFNMLCPIIQ